MAIDWNIPPCPWLGGLLEEKVMFDAPMIEELEPGVPAFAAPRAFLVKLGEKVIGKRQDGSSYEGALALDYFKVCTTERETDPPFNYRQVPQELLDALMVRQMELRPELGTEKLRLLEVAVTTVGAPFRSEFLLRRGGKNDPKAGVFRTDVLCRGLGPTKGAVWQCAVKDLYRGIRITDEKPVDGHVCVECLGKRCPMYIDNRRDAKGRPTEPFCDIEWEFNFQLRAADHAFGTARLSSKGEVGLKNIGGVLRSLQQMLVTARQTNPNVPTDIGGAELLLGLQRFETKWGGDGKWAPFLDYKGEPVQALAGRAERIAGMLTDGAAAARAAADAATVDEEPLNPEVLDEDEPPAAESAPEPAQPAAQPAVSGTESPLWARARKAALDLCGNDEAGAKSALAMSFNTIRADDPKFPVPAADGSWAATEEQAELLIATMTALAPTK